MKPLLRVCVVVALLSLSQAGYSLTRGTPLTAAPNTLLEHLWVIPLVPAIYLSYAVLPEDYTRFHCWDDAPAHQDLIVRSTFVVCHVVFWTGFAAAIFLLFRLYRGEIRTPAQRRIHVTLISTGSALAPLLILWIYFFVSGNATRRNLDFDIFAVTLSALAGGGVLSLLPLSIRSRLLLVALYCPIAFYALIYSSRYIALRLFGDRL